MKTSRREKDVHAVPKSVKTNIRNMYKFGERLTEAIEQSGMSYVQLANEIGVAGYEISQYMLGYSMPDIHKGLVIAKVLGVNPYWLCHIAPPEEVVAE